MAVNKKSPICRITNILYLLFANFQCPCPQHQKNFVALAVANSVEKGQVVIHNCG